MKRIFSKIQMTKITFFILCAILWIFLNSIALIIISWALGFLLLFEKYIRIKIPSSMAIIFVVFIVFTLVLGSYLDFYERFLWWDDLLHWFYGWAFAFLGYLIIQYISDKRGIKNEIFIICLFSLCFSIAFWAMWEIYEFTYDTITNWNMQRTDQWRWVNDTMNDIIIETIAAIIVNVYIYAYLKNWKNNWVARLSKSFKKINA